MTENTNDYRSIQQSLFNESGIPIIQKRMWAFYADILCIAFINKGIILAFQNFLRSFYYQLNYSTQIILESHIPSMTGLSFLIIYFSYFHFSYFLGEGKTPGMHFLGIKAYSPSFINHGETHLSFKESLLRSLGHLACITLAFLFIVPFFNHKRRSVSDFLSGTEIITDEKMNYFENKYQEMQKENNFTQKTFHKEVPESSQVFETADSYEHQLELDFNQADNKQDKKKTEAA